MFIYLIVTLLAAGDAFYWWWADRRLRHLRHAPLWRALLALLAGGQILVLSWWTLLPWTLRGLGGTFWVPVTAWLYTWHLLVLPVTVLFVLLGYCGIGVNELLYTMGWRKTSRERPRNSFRGFDPIPLPNPPVVDSQPNPPHASPTRRQLLAATAALLPQLALGSSLVAAATQKGHFRVRRFSLAYPNLPQILDGLTIAHLSDTHAGRFVREPQLEDIAQATFDLHPDLVVFTGDLIDFNLADLPPAVSVLRQIAKRLPMAVCVGNHDLFESASTFRRRLLTAEVPLLADEKATFSFRGERLDVLGLDWGMPASPRASGLEHHASRALSNHSPSTFAITLAHHPHAFDLAAAAGVPLTLAGHTHGGQLMLTPSLGAGSLMFKYWSGLYQKPAGQRLIVSNGVGNWFPLRINAPAEIVHITLRRATT